jgi:hypothetical protein
VSAKLISSQVLPAHYSTFCDMSTQLP